MKDYISIAQFSKIVGVSRQTIYNRIDKDLQKFVKEFDNGKMISSKALKLFDCKNNCKDTVKDSQNNVNFDTLNSVIKTLQEQLTIKDEQLKQANNQIDTLTRLLDQQQHLQAGTMTKQIERPKKKFRLFGGSKE